jgi:hypothetical protein
MSRSHLSKICFNCCLALLICLPFLVPFDASRDVDLQGLVVIIAGGFAALAAFTIYRFSYKSLSLPNIGLILLSVFSFACLLSTIVNPHKAYDILGAPYVRIGFVGVISFVVCGFMLLGIPVNKFIKYLFLIISILAWLSIPYSLVRFHSLVRLPGILNQPDIFGCILGCCLLLGWYIIYDSSQKKYWLMANQLFLTILLFLTQTRAVIAITILLSLIWLYLRRDIVSRRQIIVGGLIVTLIAISCYGILPHRLKNTAYAYQSTTYRFSLQQAALTASTHKILLGYGLGNLADALPCPSLHATALHNTCRQGYFFNSSHNILIDRILAVGWLGGLAYLCFIIWALISGWSREPSRQILCLVSLLICLYYFTNVTSVILDLIFWVLLIRIGFSKRIVLDQSGQMTKLEL